MDYSHLETIKKLALTALLSDDTLFETLVLKGGNAIDLIYQMGSRASRDLDFSMEKEFEKDQLETISTKIEGLLKESFNKSDYHIFDYKFNEVPYKISDDMKTFWGGYKIEFKIAEKTIVQKFNGDIETLRRNAKVTGYNQEKIFSIDISKFEFCGGKDRRLLDGYSIYVYTPTMIVFEKLRAICQKTEEYEGIVRTHARSARAKDFFDIWLIATNIGIDIENLDNVRLLREIFAIKKVPLDFIDLIPKYREFHRPDFQAVVNTVSTKIKLESYDFYFDFVIDFCKKIKTP